MIAARAVALALALVVLVGARRPAPPDFGEIVLDRADPVLDATVAGVPARLAVSLDPVTTLAAPFAARVPVDWRQGGVEEVGRVSVTVREAAGEVAFAGLPAAGGTVAMRLQTQPGPCCRGHDGSVGASELPWTTVRIGRPGTLAERRYPAATDRESGLSIPWQVGRDTIHLVLAPDNAETVATASAAAILAGSHGGHLAPAVRSVQIIYGISRSVRDLTFDRPVPLLGFTLARIAVRVADFAGRARLPHDPVAPADDTDAIVVRHRRPPPQHRWAAVIVGRDWLDRCPAIAVYAATGEIGLACGPG